MSEYQFKRFVKILIRKEAFAYLENLKSTHSKVFHIQYDFFKLQRYFLPNQIDAQLAKFSFLCRTRMLKVGANYKAGNPNPQCPLCKNNYDSQNHLLSCPELVGDKVCQEVPEYNDLFGENLEKMMTIVKCLKQNYKRREKRSIQ